MVKVHQIFDNLQTAVPGVYFKQRFPTAVGAGTVPQISVVLGTSRGGVPYNAADVAEQDRLIRLTSVPDALDLLRGGDAYYGCEFYMNPHNEDTLSKPLEVGFLMVNPATRSTSSLQNVAPADVIDLKSARFGAYANQLTRKITAGTSAGYWASVKLGETEWEQDDISLDLMSVRYVGTGTAATMTITSTTLSTTVTAGPGGENLTLTLADYENLAQLVEVINTQTAYTCFLETSSSEKADLFDAISAVDILTAEYTALGDVEALIRWLNGRTDSEVIASLSTGAERDPIVPDAGYVFFTGGADGAASISDWTGALEVLSRDNRVRWIGVASDDPAVHTVVRDHVRAMSTEVLMKHRQMSTGCTASLTAKADRIRAARAVTCARAEYFYQSFTRYDYPNNVNNKEFPPYLAAFMAAGTRHGNQITTSAERKFMNVLGVPEVINDTDLEEYTRAGLSTLAPSDGQVELRANVTTHQGDNELLSIPSAVRTADEVTLRVKAAIERRIAKLPDAGSNTLSDDFNNWIRSSLLKSFSENTSGSAPLARDFTEVQFSGTGTSWTLSYVCEVAVGPRFVSGVHNYITG